jgi:hypothetical protein
MLREGLVDLSTGGHSELGDVGCCRLELDLQGVGACCCEQRVRVLLRQEVHHGCHLRPHVDDDCNGVSDDEVACDSKA